MSFYAYAAEKVGNVPPGSPLWKVESAVSRCFYEWLKDSGEAPWDEYAAASEIESVARRLAGRDSYKGD